MTKSKQVSMGIMPGSYGDYTVQEYIGTISGIYCKVTNNKLGAIPRTYGDQPKKYLWEPYQYKCHSLLTLLCLAFLTHIGQDKVQMLYNFQCTLTILVFSS